MMYRISLKQRYVRFIVKAKDRLFIICLCYVLSMLLYRDNLFVFDLRGQIRHLSTMSRLILYTVVHNCNGIYVLEILSITFIFLLVQYHVFLLKKICLIIRMYLPARKGFWPIRMYVRMII